MNSENKQDLREYPRSAISLSTFSIELTLSLRGTNYRGTVWDLSRKGCSYILKKKQVLDVSVISNAINYNQVVLLSLADLVGSRDKINAVIKRISYFSDTHFILAFEFTEPLPEAFTAYLK